MAEKWTDKVGKTDGQKRKKRKKGRPFVAEVARIVTVNRNYGPVITAAGRYVSSETYLTVCYVEYISQNTDKSQSQTKSRIKTQQVMETFIVDWFSAIVVVGSSLENA